MNKKGVKMTLCDGHHRALVELCEAVGLGNNKVKSFTLKADADSLVTLKAEVYVDEEAVRELTEVIKKYELVEKENETI